MKSIVLTLHVVWLIWMIAGVVVAVGSIRFARLQSLTLFRTTHLIGIVATATVPVWADGICPLTRLESNVGQSQEDPLLLRIFAEILYWDVSPIFLSALVAGMAVLTLVLYIARPPWK